MIKYVNECCDCAVGGYPCTGQHKRVPHFICDICGDEVDDLYKYDGKELCEVCIFLKLEKVILPS